VVSGIGRGMGVFDGGGDRRREGAVLGVNVGHPRVTTGDFVAELFSEGWRRGSSQITSGCLVSMVAKVNAVYCEGTI